MDSELDLKVERSSLKKLQIFLLEQLVDIEAELLSVNEKIRIQENEELRGDTGERRNPKRFRIGGN